MVQARQAAHIAAARDWIADCIWADDIDPYSLTDDQVIRGIRRHYDGGWDGFIADGTY